jgi:hypothetical protein
MSAVPYVRRRTPGADDDPPRPPRPIPGKTRVPIFLENRLGWGKFKIMQKVKSIATRELCNIVLQGYKVDTEIASAVAAKWFKFQSIFRVIF